MADAQFTNPVEGSLVTYDATPTNILQIPIQDNASNKVNISTVAREAITGDDSRTWEQVCLIDRTDGGMPSLVGSLTDVIASLGSAGSTLWAIGITFDSTNAYVQVTGEAAQQINWFCAVTDMYVCET